MSVSEVGTFKRGKELIVLLLHMKNYILFLLFMIARCELQSQEVKVLRVVDGDTYQVLQNDKKQMIRLANVDAPELNQAFGLKVKDSLTNLIQDKNILIMVIKTDLYGRLLAKISFQGADLDSLLVAKGWAWCYAKYNRNGMLPELQQIAIQSAKGLWQCQQAVPP